MNRSVIPPELRPETRGTVADPAIRSRIGSAAAGAGENTSGYRLVVSGHNDPAARAFIQYCLDSRLPVRHLWLDNLVFRWEPMITLVSNASGIYFRGIARDESNDRVLEAVRSAVTRHPNVVMPPPSSRNWSKPLQAAHLVGPDEESLRVHPVPSRITTTPPARNDAQIVKSLSGVRSEVVATSHEALRWCDVRLPHPVQVQPRIQGDNIRVHVIADGVFACSIATDTIDYRYGSEPVMRPTSLPPEVKKWCVHMTRVEGLRFSGIDLIRDRAGGYFCFEINPMPGYDYYERRAFADSRPISAALARELDVPHIGES